MREPSLSQSFAAVSDFLVRKPLPDAIASLESNTEHATAVEVRAAALAGGRDARRPFDVETNLRVAEFKLSHWGGDEMWKREVFRDFVRLAADTSGRRAELYVLGPEPRRFLETSRSKIAWGLDRSPGLLRLFSERFGDVAMTVAAFAAGPGSRVRVIDVASMLPPGLQEAEATVN